MSKSTLFSICIVLFILTTRMSAQVVGDLGIKTNAVAANQTEHYRVPRDLGTDIRRRFGCGGCGGMATPDTTSTSIAGNSVFVELGGNGLLLSLNYEKLLFKRFGIRIGYGGAYGAGSTIPILLSYYVGEEKKVQFSAGLVYLPVWLERFPVGSEHSALLSWSFGYTYQPSSGGLTTRFALTPFYDVTRNRLMMYGGISLGLAF